ncbi:MAG: DUF4340 domain-containing protein [Cyanobacteria bacterium P01_D01_bin.105]
MLKRKTILLMVSAIALLGLVALLEGNRSVVNNRPDAPTTSSEPRQGDGERLFPFTEEDVEALEVERPEDTLAFQKQDDGTWEMKAPEVALAESGAITFLLSQITNPSTHTLTADTSALRDFGLQNPEATVTLTANDNTYQLTVGNDDFTGDQLYVRANSPASEAETPEQIKIHVVSGGMRNAVNRPTQDWLSLSSADTESEAVSPEAETENP